MIAITFNFIWHTIDIKLEFKRYLKKSFLSWITLWLFFFFCAGFIVKVRSGSRAGSVCLSHIYFPEPRLLFSLGAGTRLPGPARSDGRRSDSDTGLHRGSADRTDAARKKLVRSREGFLRTNRWECAAVKLVWQRLRAQVRNTGFRSQAWPNLLGLYQQNQLSKPSSCYRTADKLLFGWESAWRLSNLIFESSGSSGESGMSLEKLWWHLDNLEEWATHHVQTRSCYLPDVVIGRSWGRERLRSVLINSAVSSRVHVRHRNFRLPNEETCILGMIQR